MKISIARTHEYLLRMLQDIWCKSDTTWLWYPHSKLTKARFICRHCTQVIINIHCKGICNQYSWYTHCHSNTVSICLQFNIHLKQIKHLSQNVFVVYRLLFSIVQSVKRGKEKSFQNVKI